MLHPRLSLADRLRAALAAGPAAPELVGSDDWDAIGQVPAVPAAVLIAAVDRPEPGLILTRRADGLRTHAGQVAFPGGRIDLVDAGPTAAAIREADEELALPPAQVEPVAELDRFLTITDFAVTPVLAVVPPDLPLVPRAAEVAEWFELPLRAALDPANRSERMLPVRGASRRVFEIRVGARVIWGATAAMLVNLHARLGCDW